MWVTTQAPLLAHLRQVIFSIRMLCPCIVPLNSETIYGIMSWIYV